MKYLSVADMAKKWNLSKRSVRNYCAKGRANLIGKTWQIPENAEKPVRICQEKEQSLTLLDILQEEKRSQYSGGIYHKTQIDLTYNSNHIEGSRLTHDQTRYIFETNTIGVQDEALNIDDVIETVNHFRCIDLMIGRVGRLIMFKECLKYNIVPFIIDEALKMYYYRGLKEWNKERGYLRDTCLTAQDQYKRYLDYFRISYE